MTSLTPIRNASPRPAPTWHRAPILNHYRLAAHYRFLRLSAPGIARTTQPGQFVMLTLARAGDPGPVLPRPMAVYRRDRDQGTIDIVYGVVGSGTTRLSQFEQGEELLVTGPLGQGFHIRSSLDRLLLIGRGIGNCSLTTVAEDHRNLVAVISARSPETLIGGDVFNEHGAERVYEVTDTDGTSSVEHLHARLTRDLDDNPPHQILTCGSRRLAQLAGELGERWSAGVQVSVEAHMACGLGYCHGCAFGAVDESVESPLICVDGPVFRLREATR
jgi:dihydroorotate dehydrogenase electron transfer subunit